MISDPAVADLIRTYTWIVDHPLPLRLMIVGRKTLKL
jgi:hypothetical protein